MAYVGCLTCTGELSAHCHDCYPKMLLIVSQTPSEFSRKVHDWLLSFCHLTDLYLLTGNDAISCSRVWNSCWKGEKFIYPATSIALEIALWLKRQTVSGLWIFFFFQLCVKWMVILVGIICLITKRKKNLSNIFPLLLQYLYFQVDSHSHSRAFLLLNSVFNIISLYFFWTYLDTM